MQFRPLVPMGLALVVTAGCQSYFPNGYGYNGPYSAFPSGTYAQPGAGGVRGQSTGQYPTRADGQTNSTTGQSGGSTSKNSSSGSNTRNSGDLPSDLGAAATEDERSSIKRGKSSGGNPGGSVDSVPDEPDEPVSSLDEENFVSPAVYRAASANSDAAEPRRLSARSRPSPYKKDPNGYRWLRGTVSRDSKSKAWRIRYSDDPNDGDPYGGSLALVDDEGLDTLIDNDVIVVEGTIDQSVPDRFGKPSYRVERMDRLKPKEN